MSYTPPAEIAAFLACLFFALALVNQAARLWYALRGKPTPAEIATASASLSERIGRIESSICAYQADHSRRIATLESTQAALRELISQELGKVYNRVNAVADDCAGMRGVLGIIETQLTMLIDNRRIAP